MTISDLAGISSCAWNTIPEHVFGATSLSLSLILQIQSKREWMWKREMGIQPGHPCRFAISFPQASHGFGRSSIYLQDEPQASISQCDAVAYSFWVEMKKPRFHQAPRASQYVSGCPTAYVCCEDKTAGQRRYMPSEHFGGRFLYEGYKYLFVWEVGYRKMPNARE